MQLDDAIPCLISCTAIFKSSHLKHFQPVLVLSKHLAVSEEKEEGAQERFSCYKSKKRDCSKLPLKKTQGVSQKR